jgi:alcohol dehydrogenase YqhD (iron-dependent ADH family)
MDFVILDVIEVFVILEVIDLVRSSKLDFLLARGGGDSIVAISKDLPVCTTLATARDEHQKCRRFA